MLEDWLPECYGKHESLGSERTMLARFPELAYVWQMAKKTTKRIASLKEIEQAIHVIRGQRVMLDSDLAALYGVTTRQLNQQVSRNSDRFPDDFAYQLMPQ
jgi:hypothetical protein